MLAKLRSYIQLLKQTRSDLHANRLLMGQLMAKSTVGATTLAEAEFKVFSQFGDDGIIQYLIRHAQIRDCSFVEFGVENYLEANTRFLLLNNRWRGLVMDGSQKHITDIQAEELYWQQNITAKTAFISTENINQLLADDDFSGPIGLLSIDIDGNDYWIWQAITNADPDIVIVEYNSLFGIERAITVPYQSDFVRSKAHYSHLYFGASLRAFCDLAEAKGYAFVGCNSAGINAYFVKKSQLGSLVPVSLEEGFVDSVIRESRDQTGKLSFMGGKKRADLLKGLPVYNIRTSAVEPF
jgi:hypothetical protein